MNTCIEALGANWEGIHTIAYYSHLVPVVIAVFLGIFAVIKTKASPLSLVFVSFTSAFSLWLLGDLIDWVSGNYFHIYFTWSWLDFINVVFFVFGALFYGLLAHEKISLWEKISAIALCIPAFVITAAGLSVVEFTQPICEAVNSDLLTNYKLAAETIVVAYLLFSFGRSWKNSEWRKRLQMFVVLAALLLFFVTFAGTEYIASVTGIYETNLYSLFVLPVFLIIMVFSVTNLGLFNFRLLGTQILSYVLILMSGSQLLLVQDSAHGTLAVITLGVSMVFGVLLLQNAQKEEQARTKIEELAKQLEKANEQQVVLIHFITHQIKGFVTKSRNIFSMALEGDFGQIPEQLKPMLEEGFNSDTKGVATIQEILNASNIKSGKVEYAMAPFDVKTLIEGIVLDLKPFADKKGVAIVSDLGNGAITIKGDKGQLTNAFKNLIDNSIKYTPKGEVRLKLSQERNKVIFSVQDTGVGITQEDMKNLFTEGGHGKDSTKVNVESTGFGLYIVKNIVDAHKGRVWAESEGRDKGSRFIVALPL
jgi:signal transduction histidine kinase